MSAIARFDSPAGEVLVEIDERLDVGIQRVARDERGVARAAADLDKALDSVLPAAGRLFEKLETLKPSSAALEFGIKLSAEAGALIAKTAGEAHFNVTLSWQPQSPAQGGS